MYFLCAGATEGKVICVGKALRLHNRWGHKKHRTRRNAEAEKTKSGVVQGELKFLEQLGLDLYIRWLVLDAGDEVLATWHDYAIKVLNPFFLTKEVYKDTVLFLE